jgi:hypothetical protein
MDMGSRIAMTRLIAAAVVWLTPPSAKVSGWRLRSERTAVCSGSHRYNAACLFLAPAAQNAAML